jgi:uncharacterized membrane protein YtjA (UPF0391 family)
MLSYSLACFIVAVIAAVLGFGGILAGDQGLISRVMFFVFLVCYIVTLILGLMEPRRKRGL